LNTWVAAVIAVSCFMAHESCYHVWIFQAGVYRWTTRARVSI